MDFIEIVTGLAVVLTVPALIRALWQVKRFAETRQPPRRGDIARPDKHAEAHSG
jgi:hypothetical protein